MSAFLVIVLLIEPNKQAKVILSLKKFLLTCFEKGEKGLHFGCETNVVVEKSEGETEKSGTEGVVIVTLPIEVEKE